MSCCGFLLAVEVLVVGSGVEVEVGEFVVFGVVIVMVDFQWW